MTRCEWPLIAGAREAMAAARGAGTVRRICTVGGVLPDHPLADLITAAAAGRFPAADGGWRRVPPWRPGLEASFAFTGHSVFAVAPDVTEQRLAALGADGFGGAQDPRLITALAGPGGWIDCLDLVMAGHGS